jgi:hypothetical protein
LLGRNHWRELGNGSFEEQSRPDVQD